MIQNKVCCLAWQESKPWYKSCSLRCKVRLKREKDLFVGKKGCVKFLLVLWVWGSVGQNVTQEQSQCLFLTLKHCI